MVALYIAVSACTSTLSGQSGRIDGVILHYALFDGQPESMLCLYQKGRTK